MPSARPPADDDDEESECRAVVYQTEFNFVLIIHVVMLLLSVKLQFPSIDPHRSLSDRLQSTGLDRTVQWIMKNEFQLYIFWMSSV